MRTITGLFSSGTIFLLCLAGCDGGTSSSLIGGGTTNVNGANTNAASTATGPGSYVASHNPAPSHHAQSIGGDNGITDPIAKTLDDATIGTPDEVARMHGTQKIHYAMLGNILTDFGVSLTAAATTTGNGNKNNNNAVAAAVNVLGTGKGAGSQCSANGTCCDEQTCCNAANNCCNIAGTCCDASGNCLDANGDPINVAANSSSTSTQSLHVLANNTTTTTPAAATPQTAAQLYSGGASALGAPVYQSRTPEMVIPSTSALAKEFDIFMAAAPAIISGAASSKRCPGVTALNGTNLSQDFVSCLMGKPATADHMQIAQQLISASSTPAIGQELAVATLLAAAHVSE